MLVADYMEGEQCDGTRFFVWKVSFIELQRESEMCEETAHVIVTCSIMIIFYLFFKRLLGI